MEKSIYYLIDYIGFFITTFLFSFLINGLFLKFSRTLGIRSNESREIRWSATTKPAFGGISFYIIFLLSVASHAIFFQSNAFLDLQLIGVLTACTIGFIVGLADDAYNTKPFLKFFAQIICAAILIVTGTYINFFPWDWVNYTLTVFWVIGLMNSINMLDNMDGITTSVSISVVLSAIFMLITNSDYSNIHFIILIGVLSALLGFLYFNWNPSKMYMGDTGSQFLGVFLAAMGIIYFWNVYAVDGDIATNPKIQTKQLIIPLLVFIIPIIDTTTVVINRLIKRQSPFVGGKDHTTHHVSYLGFTDSQVAWIYFDLSLFSLLLLIIIEKYIINWGYTHFLIFLTYFLVLFTALYSTTRINRKKENN